MTMTKDEALAGLRASHEEFVSWLNAFTPEGWAAPLPTGTWRVRDAAAHIAVWDRLLAGSIRVLPNDQVPDWLSWDDAKTNEVNEQQISNSAGWALDRLRAELRDARAEVLDAVAALSEAQFVQTYRSGDVETSAEGLCAYWLRHDRAHIGELPA